MYISNVEMSWEDSPEGFASSVRTAPPILRDTPLFKEFSITGQFWLPSRPERPLWGSLQFKPGDRIYVTLDGSLFDEHVGDYSEFDVLHGRTYNGSPCTLFGCNSYGTTYFGEEDHIRSEVWADYLVRGDLFTSLENCKFSAIYVRFSHLDDWFNPPYIIRHKRGGYKKSLITFSPDEFEVSLSLSGQNFKLKPFCGRTIPSRASREGACWTYFYKFYIQPSQPQTLNGT